MPVFRSVSNVRERQIADSPWRPADNGPVAGEEPNGSDRHTMCPCRLFPLHTWWRRWESNPRPEPSRPSVLHPARSVAELAAVSCVPFANVVVRAAPFQRTVEGGTKPLPVTVNVNATPPMVALLGACAVSTGVGLGFATVTVTGALVTAFPARSTAWAVSVCAAFVVVVVFQRIEYGGVVTATPWSIPSSWNCTPA